MIYAEWGECQDCRFALGLNDQIGFWWGWFSLAVYDLFEEPWL